MVIVGNEQLQIPKSLGDDVEHRPVGGKRNVLHQPGHAQARLPPHPAAIRRERSGQHLEQRGFARAIPSDNRDAFARFDLEGNRVEERKVAVGDGHLVQGDQGHLRGTSMPRAAQTAVRCRTGTNGFYTDAREAPVLQRWPERTVTGSLRSRSSLN